MKKLLALTLSFLMILTVFSGCQGEKISSDLYDPSIPVKDAGGLKLPLSDGSEEITWSVTVSADTETPNDSWFAKKLRGMTGANVKFEAYPSATALEKLNVLAASQQLPDIVGQGFKQSIADDLSMQGAFAAVEDYIDVLPNFKKNFVGEGSQDWIFKSYSAPDGKLYGYYGWDYSRDINTNATMYRKDIFDKHGLKMWNNPEEFYQTMKKLKELYPNSTPYTTKSGDGIFKALSVSWDMEAYMPFYNEKDGKWYYTDITPKYKEMLDFIKKCYNEGLIDPEFLTNTQASWTAKMTQADKAFVTTDWIGRMEMFKEQTKDTVPSYDLRFANPIGPDQVMRTPNQLCWARYVSNNKKAETAFKLLDFVASPTGKELVTMGIEGETYEIGENGMAKYIGFDKTPSTTELEGKYGMFLEGLYLSFDRRSAYFNFTQREQEAQDFAKDPKNLTPIDPILQFTEEEKEVINEYQLNLEKAGKEFATKYVLGNASWDEWVKKAKSLGADKIIEIYNAAQARYDKM